MIKEYPFICMLFVAVMCITCIQQKVNYKNKNSMLNNKWVLYKLSRQLVNSTHFTHGLPYLEFNTELNQVTGYSGCNRLNSKVEVNGNELIFMGIMTTRKGCFDTPLEKSFLAILNNSPIQYKIEKDALVLLKDNKIQMVLNKGK